MDLNIDLRNDTFLFPSDGNFGDKTYKNHNSHIMVGHLNRQGIYTINDLINSTDENFSKGNRHYFMAVIRILRYKYLGEELVVDVIFNGKYNLSDDFDITRKKLAKDLRWLGFGHSLSDCQNFAASFLRVHKDDKFITMEDCLNDDRIVLDNIGSSNLREFYLNFIAQKKVKDEDFQSLPLSIVLESLKLQMAGLRVMRDNLNYQINTLENMIERYSATQESLQEQEQVKKHARKRRIIK